MKCETAQQVFSDYVEETIESPLALTFERHLNQCDDCRKAYGEFRSAWRTLETFPVVEPPSGFRASVLEKVRASQEVAPKKVTFWRPNWGNALGIRVPARGFAWALSALIFMALLIQVTPGVFQSTFIGTFGAANVPTGPGMDVAVRVSDAGTNADVYQIALRPADKATRINAKLCWAKSGKQFRDADVSDGKDTVILVVVQQPQEGTEPLDVAVRWNYSGRDYSRLIYLPRSHSVSEAPYMHLNGDLQSALRQVAGAYGVAVSADAGTTGSVELSGKFETAKVALNQLAEQSGLELRKEGARAYRLEPR
jgi:hypothetical protein